MEEQVAGILGRSKEGVAMTKEELAIVVKWLQDRHQYLHKEKLIIECGDDFAISNGKGPLLDRLSLEASAIGISLRTAKDQLNEAK